MEFPQYRKMNGFKRYYKISDDRHFTEVYELNGQQVVHSVTAEQYPEMLRIQDMLKKEFSYVEMTGEEIEEVFGS